MANTIYVGNLPWEAKEDDIRGLFQEFGEIESVNIVADRMTGRPRGYCFIDMDNAEQAIAELNEKEFGGRNLRVNLAREKREHPAESGNKIYVGNLPWDTNESDIKELFQKYGEVTSVNMITDRETGRPRGFCFIEMVDPDMAISELDDKEFGGRNLKVNRARERARR
jgi:nucleolin